MQESKLVIKKSKLQGTKDILNLLKKMGEVTVSRSYNSPITDILLDTKEKYFEATDGHRLIRLPFPEKWVVLEAKENDDRAFINPDDLPAKNKVNSLFEVPTFTDDRRWPDTSFLFREEQYPYTVEVPFSVDFIKIIQAVAKFDAPVGIEFTPDGMKCKYEGIKCEYRAELKILQPFAVQARCLVDFFQFCKVLFPEFMKSFDPISIFIDYRSDEEPLRFRPFDCNKDFLTYIIMPFKIKDKDY